MSAAGPGSHHRDMANVSSEPSRDRFGLARATSSVQQFMRSLTELPGCRSVQAGTTIGQ
jgi:hypothetical protein